MFAHLAAQTLSVFTDLPVPTGLHSASEEQFTLISLKSPNEQFMIDKDALMKTRKVKSRILGTCPHFIYIYIKIIKF